MVIGVGGSQARIGKSKNFEKFLIMNTAPVASSIREAISQSIDVESQPISPSQLKYHCK